MQQIRRNGVLYTENQVEKRLTKYEKNNSLLCLFGIMFIPYVRPIVYDRRTGVALRNERTRGRNIAITDYYQIDAARSGYTTDTPCKENIRTCSKRQRIGAG